MFLEPCSTILEENNEHSTEELKVYFVPPLYQQRRMWILDVLRREKIIDVVDVGCGEGELLAALSQPAPWLSPPPDAPLDDGSSESIPNLHPVTIAGLDLFTSARDLDFAVQGTTPPPTLNMAANKEACRYTQAPKRWEPMSAKIWKGGLQVINEEFVGAECIVSTEVIEHLPPDIFPYFAPMLLGVYHPQFLLITTPSYTFNARFTAPNAPPSARSGFVDPTGRTNRKFRHDDHKFEWTIEEFKDWCAKVAAEWGYQVHTSDVGRPTEKDPWDRDEALGGATQLAEFRQMNNRDTAALEQRAREVIANLDNEIGLGQKQHELLAHHRHEAHPKSKQPATLQEIGDAVKTTLERYGDVSQKISELWFDDDIPILCGGWMEILVRAVEAHENLRLRREDTKYGQEYWIAELIGAVPLELWPSQGDESVGESLVPVEETYYVESSTTSGLEDSGDEEADISWNEADEVPGTWGKPDLVVGNWAWNKEEEKPLDFAIPLPSSTSSMTGWDGDDSDSDLTS